MQTMQRMQKDLAASHSVAGFTMYLQHVSGALLYNSKLTQEACSKFVSNPNAEMCDILSQVTI
jgi:hypothetical protein